MLPFVHFPSVLLCYILLCECSLVPSRLTLCDPMDCSPPGSSVHGISQARILEQIAIPFSRASSQPRDQSSCIARRILAFAGKPHILCFNRCHLKKKKKLSLTPLLHLATIHFLLMFRAKLEKYLLVSFSNYSTTYIFS